MFGEQHHYQHHHRHHHDDGPPGDPFASDGPGDSGPGRGRGRGRGHRGPGGRGFGPGGIGRGFGPGGPGPGFGPEGIGPDLGPGGIGPDFGPEGAPWHGFGPGPHVPGPHAPGPHGRRRRPKGAIREAVLSLLTDGPANGYGLMRRIAERTEGAWTPSPGSVYPTLAQLVDEGLISATSAEKGTDFVLTEEGRQYAATHAEALEQVWTDPMRGAPSHAALRDSALALMSAMRQFRFATDDQRQRAAQQLDEARRALHRILAE